LAPASIGRCTSTGYQRGCFPWRRGVNMNRLIMKNTMLTG
jgi:hypothetical protein